ncbi:MAG TPA: hypothetical protein VIY68_03280 [Steroidobacteraceae bacterium]
MDENHVAGTARNVGGKAEEGFGRGADDSETRAEGLVNHAAGAASDTAATLEQWLRRTIETQPYTAAIAAAGIGWLLGRMHRPL